MSSVLKAWAFGLINNLQLFWAPLQGWMPIAVTGKETVSPRGQQQDHSSLLFEPQCLVFKSRTLATRSAKKHHQVLVSSMPLYSLEWLLSVQISAEHLPCAFKPLVGLTIVT